MITTTFDAPPLGGYFKFAKEESKKSSLRIQVGACLVIGKSIIKGHNKKKTHPVFANPQLHIKTSLHAELDCLSTIDDVNGATIFVYRQTSTGQPALARPCEHCMSFLKKHGIEKIYYTISESPYWAMEYV